MAAENEIHLTCAKCATVYRLDPVNLGDGCMVRCTACKKEWYQGAPVEGVIPEPLDAPPAPVMIAAAPEEVQPEIPAEPPEWMKDDEPVDDLAFRPTTKGQYFLEDDMRVIPEAVMPQGVKDAQGNLQIPVITHRPFGMGAGAYGASVFLFLFCVTFSGLLLERQVIVQRYPVMLTLYDALHVGVEAPGQGLAFSAMTAESHIDKNGRTLAVDVKLANITDHDLPRPVIKVIARGMGDTVLKDWSVSPDKPVIAAGESVPLKLKLPEAPGDAKTADLAVTAD
jgi:predicted Zn finger-like uncharacterized protein